MEDGTLGNVVKAGSRRDEILSAVAKLFWANGYSATTMREIAAALGMQKASLYHHVANKETFLYDLSMASMSRIIDVVSAAEGRTPREHLEIVIERHLVALLSDQNKHATALTELRALSPNNRHDVTELRDQYDKLVEDAITAVQLSENLWPGTSPKLLRLALLGMLNWTVFWYRPGGGDQPEDIAHAFTAVFLGARDSS